MDITQSISALLYYHDCVIIPGFGGFVCRYCPAQIHPILHTLTPPSKAISFNINLRSSDGLLASHLAKSMGITYAQATLAIDNWGASSITLLDSEKELKLGKIGRLLQDVEGGWQFEPDGSVNYLPSSFGLPVIIAPPVLRGKEIEFELKPTKPNIQAARRWSNWKIAASVLLVAGIGLLSAMMFSGHVIEPLKLNEAGVMSALLRISGTNEPVIKPIPPISSEPVKTTPTVPDNYPKSDDNTVVHSAPVVNENPGTGNNSSVQGHNYYIIVGVFASHYNLEKAKTHILSAYPSSSLYEESYNGLTRIGYLVGTDAGRAKHELVTAKAEDSTYWLLQK